MMDKPLLSVIIPTHNRSIYAISAIQSLLDINGHIEIVVCDTSDKDKITKEFKNVACEKLKILRPNKRLNVVENFRFGLAAANGYYLVFIGDDDLVSGNIVPILEWAKNKNIDAIKFVFSANYYWPDFSIKDSSKKAYGKLVVGCFTGNAQPFNPKYASDHALNYFGQGVLDMPRAYLGVVSRNLVDKIEINFGSLFGGVSPDVYSAFLISHCSDNCFIVDYPAIIPGASGVSATGQSFNGGHLGGLRENDHIIHFHDLVWDKKIPEFYSVATVWSFSLLKAVEKCGHRFDNANFVFLYFRCLLYKGYKIEVLKAFFQFLKNSSVLVVFKMFFSAAVSFLSYICKKIYTVTKIKRTQPVIIKASNSYHARVAIDQFLKDRCKIPGSERI